MSKPIKVNAPHRCGTCTRIRAMMPTPVRTTLERLEDMRLAKKAAKAKRKALLAARIQSGDDTA